MATIQLCATRCAICDVLVNATELYPANFTEAAFNPSVFSARRMPDRVHARIVKCNTCKLVRSDPMADPASLADLYQRSTFEYAGEVENLRRTYGRYLRKLEALGTGKGSLLEIGCGNGFFLEEALAQGFIEVRGVEPSAEAVAQASPAMRDCISCDIMRPGLFAPEMFDVVCMFQVFDHIPHPAEMLDECRRVLKNGGLLLLLNHNIEAVSARLLGESSPIIDLEHTYLYSRKTLAQLVEARGFSVRQTGPVWNTYTLQYAMRLLPLPNRFKQALLTVLEATKSGAIHLNLPLGNLYLVAQKTV